jgi:hypothetical protein
LGGDQVTGQVRGEAFPPSLVQDVAVEGARSGEVVVVSSVVPGYVSHAHLNEGGGEGAREEGRGERRER